MAILKIIKDSDPTLRKASRKVETISKRIITLLDDMRDTLHEANGVGIAAVQVGVLRRIVVIEVEQNNVIELINPQIIESNGVQNEVEGCLSLPELCGLTNRPLNVTVKALNRSGNEFTITGSNLLARAFCHEIDHLDGKLFTDNAIKMLTKEEMEQLEKE